VCLALRTQLTLSHICVCEFLYVGKENVTQIDCDNFLHYATRASTCCSSITAVASPLPLCGTKCRNSETTAWDELCAHRFRNHGALRRCMVSTGVLSYMPRGHLPRMTTPQTSEFKQLQLKTSVAMTNVVRRRTDVAVITSPPRGTRNIAMSMSVCLSVRSHVSRTTLPDLHKFPACACCLWPRLGPLLAALRRHVLPVLWMMSCFQTMDCMVRERNRLNYSVESNQILPSD